MRLYDLVLVLRSSLSDKDQEKLLETVKGWLGKVKIAKEESWGQKPLAYKIKKELSGIYHKFELEADPTTESGIGSIPADFEKRLNAQENVLRHLLLRKK